MKRTIVLSILFLMIGVSLSAQTTFAVSQTTTDTAQTRLDTIKTKGSQEIDRRLARLNTLSTKIAAATKLSATNKAALTTQVTTEISGLTALRTTLNAETTLAAAKTDAQSIISGYRVYALIVPKVYLVKVADDQQANEAKVAALIPRLQTALTNAKNAGKDTVTLQIQLDDASSKQQAAQAISSTIESKVINLQPTDYNSDHTLLSGDRDQLVTARTDLKTAVDDMAAVRDGLKK